MTTSFGTLPPQRLSTVSIDDCNTAYRAVSELIALGHRASPPWWRPRTTAPSASCAAAATSPRCGTTASSRTRRWWPARAASAWRTPTAPRARSAPPGRTSRPCSSSPTRWPSPPSRPWRTRGATSADCSVIAVDGLALSQYTRPTLTTMCQPSDRMGEESVRILLDMIERRAGNRSLVLESTLRAGASVAPRTAGAEGPRQ